MEQSYDINNIINSIIVRTTLNNIFKQKETEIIERPASFIIRLKKESEDTISRIIILPPHGFTANKPDETNPHDEVRRAKIEIKWWIKINKVGFSLLKNVLKYQYYTIRNIKITEDEPYPKIGGQNYKEDLKSSKQKFFVVKEDGTGFYHSLINMSNERLLLVLEKDLRLQKIPNLKDKKQEDVIMLYDKIILYWDTIFEKEKELIERISNIDFNKTIPPLIEMLNIFETGKHEPCTVYAIILKIGKINKKVVNYLKEAVKNKTAPKYYLEELIKKLAKY